MLPILLLLAGADDGAMERYQRMTAAEPRCVYDPTSTDVTVCGLRNADRFRVPFVGSEEGDPAIQDVPSERRRMLNRRSPVEELNLFLVGGGMAGVTVSTRGGVSGYETRKLAP
ncbi:hypothetical protein M0208_04680 [Sphingomonas sp. SUN019]|uniref:hypothetical protein n=1 Tax=Sphingomonas sp. SUN019 TaxID=2937788 RepID=UPI0021644BEF|nr:hypothetical protein [Sphingomonas sp. SUN019]UVO49848.1 hypothetical protein M0208_04680 [Sphingomonas sp. SUN019]